MNQNKSTNIADNLETGTDWQKKAHDLEEILNAVFNSSRFIHAVLDRDFHVLAFNQKAEEAVGSLFQTRLEAGVSVFKFLRSEFHHLFVGTFAQTLLNGDFSHGEQRKVLASGEVVWYDFSFYPIKDKEGTVEKIAFSCFDITERKNAEEALRKSEANLRATFDSNHLLFYLINQNLEVELFNKTAYQITYEAFGKGIEIGHSMLEYILPSAHESFKNNFSRALAGEIISADGLASYGKDQQRWLEYTHYPVVNQADSKIERVLFCIQDISARKFAQIALAESEHSYRAIFEQAAAGMYRLDLEGNILQVNDTFCQMLGYERNALEGKNIMYFIDYEEVKHLKDNIKTLIENKESILKTEQEYYNVHQRPTWTLVTLSLVRKTNGEPNYVLGIIQNISELKKIQQDLADRNKELDTYVYRASHDLRGPISSLKGLVNLIKDNIFDPEELPRYIGMLEDRLNRLNAIIDNLIHIGQLRKSEIQLRPLNAKFMIKNAINKFREHPHFERVTFEIENKLEEPLYTDRQMFDTIMHCLLENSLQYLRTAVPTRIRIEIEKIADYQQVTVSDNGQGIPTESHDRLFDMFFRANAGSTGLGLGLYIVKTAVDRLGGEIGFSSQYAQGSTFTILFPKNKNHENLFTFETW